LRILTLLVFHQGANSARDSSYVYFALASAVLVLCTVLFVYLLRLPITRHYHAKHQASQRHSAGPPIDTSSSRAKIGYGSADVTTINGSGSPQHNQVIIEEDSDCSSGSSDDADGVADDSAIDNAELGAAVGSKRKIAHWSILFKLGRHAFCVFAVFFVTLSLFPGIVTKVPAREGGEDWKFWYPILLLSLFMVFDWAGRSAPSYWRPIPERWLWFAALARFAFFPLFAFCIKPLYFTSDWIPCMLVVVMAYTNGAWGTESMMVGPTQVEPYEREVAGVMMSFMLNLGIFLGVHMAVLMLYLETGSTGFNL